MRTIIHLVILLVAATVQTAIAQDFKGFATYKTSSSVDIKLDSTQVSDAQQAQIQAMLQKSMQREYELKFNKVASTWKEAESLGEAPGASAGGIQIKIMGGGGSDLLYKDTKEKKFAEATDMFGKKFLVQDELETFEWKLGSETKQIGQYTCYKATAEREVTSMSVSMGDGVDEEDQEPKEEKSTQTITAWYTPQIPVSHGPDNYWGLPGLILEVNNGNRVMICNKIVLNPKEEIVIEAPTEGKKVNSEEFEVIMREKMKEMEKMYSGGRKKGGERMQIRIGG